MLIFTPVNQSQPHWMIITIRISVLIRRSCAVDYYQCIHHIHQHLLLTFRITSRIQIQQLTKWLPTHWKMKIVELSTMERKMVERMPAVKIIPHTISHWPQRTSCITWRNRHRVQILEAHRDYRKTTTRPVCTVSQIWPVRIVRIVKRSTVPHPYRTVIILRSFIRSSATKIPCIQPESQPGEFSLVFLLVFLVKSISSPVRSFWGRVFAAVRERWKQIFFFFIISPFVTFYFRHYRRN